MQNGPIAWFAKNHVAANLFMLLILVGGLVTLPGIKQEIFPELSSELLSITVDYFGAAPDEVEESICSRIEESVQGLTGIKRIRSTAREGGGTVYVEMTTDADRRRLLEDVKARVDSIDTFPVEAERPLVQELVMRRQVVNIAVTGPSDDQSLRAAAERVRDDLSEYDSISLVSLANARPYEISIEISEDALRQYGLSFDGVARAIRNSSLDLPGGSVKTRGGEVLIRSKGQAYTGSEFEEITLLTQANGTRVKVSDIGRVIDGFADTDQTTRFDGKKSILVQAFRVGEQSALDISNDVADYISRTAETLPEGITLTAWQDDAKILRSRLDLMLRNGRAGLVLVFVTLALFLRLKLAFWVALGIPISFLGSIALLPTTGISINLLSLFAFIVVLGIVVDDAIVVAENIYTHVQRGKGRLDAAISGAREVGAPVIFAVLTTIAAFSPLMGVPGRYGEIMRVIPVIVISTLIFSLLESLFILPCHLSNLTKDDEDEPKPGLFGFWAAIQNVVSNGLAFVVQKYYRPVLSKAIEMRYLTVTIGVVVLAITFSFIGAGWIKFVFFPPVDADNVVVYLTMPQGTPREVTEEAIARVEDAAEEVRAELAEEFGTEEYPDVFIHSMTSVGGQPFREAQAQNRGELVSFSAGHLAEVNIELSPSESRSVSSKEIARRWRQKLGSVPDAEELLFSSSIFASGDINVELSSSNYEELQIVAAKVKANLNARPGVIDVNDSFELGKQELKLNVRPSAETMGVSLGDLSRQMRQGFYGEEIQRIQRGRDDVKIMLRYPERERRSLGDVENTRIRTPAGDEIPFSTVALVDYGRGYSTIDRADRRRVISVTATVESSKANTNEINDELNRKVLPAITRDHPSVDYAFEGDQRDQADAMQSLAKGAIFALVLIYSLLAIPFRSYTQPLIVMIAIPFGVVGAVWGHMIMGLDMTFLSMFGIIALTGVLVNDSLVMVDFINRKIANGDDVLSAVRESGAARFRAIMLTSLTTFASLIPLLLERSLQAQFLIPMAASLGWGVLFATFITLLLVPVGYFIIEDMKSLFSRITQSSRT